MNLSILPKELQVYVLSFVGEPIMDKLVDKYLDKVELKKKYKSRKYEWEIPLIILKLRNHNSTELYCRNLKNLSLSLDEFNIKMSIHKLSKILRTYGNDYHDDNIEYIGYFTSYLKYHRFRSMKKEKQSYYWNNLTSDFSKLYPILSY